MEILVGTDIIEVERIKEAMQDENFVKRVFTEKEIEYCENKKETVKYQHYSARFAGKEAVFKAISKSLKNKYDISWKNIEITNDNNNRPIAKIIYKTNEEKENLTDIIDIKIDISISHIKDLAVATAVVMI